MKKLIIALLILALPSMSWAGSQQIRQVVGMAKVQGGGGCTHTVEWDMTADGLDCFNATDGSTTTTSGISYSSEGAEFNNNADYAKFTVTDGNSINKGDFVIGLKYKQTGTVPSYAALFEHSYSTRAIAFFRDGTSSNAFRFYVNNFTVSITSTVTNFWDGAEHSLVLTFVDATNTFTISVDGESPVSGTHGYSPPEMSSGFLHLGNDVAQASNCGGIISDFYIQ